MGTFKPSTLVLHDYGGSPQNRDGVFNPYHALVFPDGSIKYRNPNNPYGQPAPHAFRMNPESIGLSYAGHVGSRPTPAAMETLRTEAQKIGGMFPGIRPMGHGEAFQATRGTNKQASRDGRDLVEASWRSNIIYGPPAPGEAQVASGPVPVSDRSLTAFAGLTPKAQPNQRMSLGGPMPAKQQTEGPSWWGDMNARLQNPLFLGGLGMLVAANQGQDAASALNSGLRTGAGLQDQMMQNSQRQRERAKQQALEEFWNSYDSSQLPAGVAGVMPGLSASQKAELVLQNATGQLPTRDDAVTKRRLAAASLRQTELENEMFPLRQQQVEAEIASKKAQVEQGRNGKYGLQPIYGVDASGNPIIMQIGPSGEAIQTKLPEGAKVDLGVKSREQAAGTAAGKATAEAKVNLPQAEYNAKKLNDLINSVLTDPYLPQMTGPVAGRLPNISGASNRVQSKIDQIQGKTFLQAYESLKGSGQITEIEGKKAEESLQRLQNTRVGTEDYISALQEFRADVADLLTLARAKAAGGYQASQPQQPARQSDWSIRRLD